jgi:hypothetical protein
MKSKLNLVAAALFIGGVAAGVLYANIDVVEARLAGANHIADEAHGAAAQQADRDQFGCHRHGPVSHHCH